MAITHWNDETLPNPETTTGAQQKADAAEQAAKTYAETKADAAEQAAKTYADTKASQAEQAAKTYADGKFIASDSVLDSITLSSGNKTFKLTVDTNGSLVTEEVS